MAKPVFIPLLRLLYTSSSFDFRNPEAMRAATKEVQSILESAGEEIRLDGNYISLNRKQLDNMPVLGITILFRSTTNCPTIFNIFY